MSSPAIEARPTVNLLPGPVAVHPDVRDAFVAPPVSHRGAAFMEEMASLRARLARLVGAARVAILVGSGTLANDAVGAQLAVRKERGLVVTTGEFGSRLLDHARRWDLSFAVHESPWGEAPDYEAIESTLSADPGIRWLWTVHCETSTGVVADLDRLKAVAARHDVDLCLDAVSSIGTMPVDLAGVHLASGASNKGLASYPGLALVFADHALAVAAGIPRYLDLGQYEAQDGVPYTHSSNLVRALAVALRRFDGNGGADAHFVEKARRSDWLRGELEARGYAVMAPRRIASPAVLTLALPREQSALELGEALDEEHIHLSYRSGYLVERNLLQICLMGEYTQAGLRHLLDSMGRAGAPAAPGPE